jgi:nucleoredoxin
MSAFEQLFGETLQSHNGNIGTSDALSDKIVLVYFSAHWCPPCRQFTPELVVFYNSMKSKGENFELVFVSSDKDNASFEEYFHEMPWLALPFADRDRKNKLSANFGNNIYVNSFLFSFIT